MELIGEIINLLVDEDKSLNSAFLKTKVLASRIKNNSLAEWVNNESNGYINDETLPDYRRDIQTLVQGDYIVGNAKYQNQTIPVYSLSEKYNIDLTKIHFRQSISFFESFSGGANGQILAIPIEAEITGLIEHEWRSLGNPYLSLNSARRIITISTIKDLLAKVRNKLLDFMLEVENQFGHITEFKDLSLRNNEITNVFYQTVINNSGNDNIVNTGDQNQMS